MPLPPARPAEIEEAREAEAQEEEQEQQAQQAEEPPRAAPAMRLAARTDTPPLPARRPPGRAMPLPPARPAEIEEAREAEAQEAEQQAQQPSGVRLAARTTAPEPAPAPAFAPFAPPPAAEPAPDTAAPAAEPAGLPAVCAALVEEGAILADLDKSIPRKGSCGLAEPVRLSGVRLADGSMVPLKPASITNCAVAAQMAAWVREEVAPAAATLGAAVTAVRVAASYDCRPRNRIPGARMSEHGLGNAIDVGGIELADGRVLRVEKGGLPPRLRAVMKDSACRRFTTVLGPGSDGYHEDHIHVDLAQRRLDIRLCRWNLDAGAPVAARKDKPAPGKPDGAPTSAHPPETETAPTEAASEPAGGSGSAKP
ncbi:extensin family protein [Xanthobacter sp. V3C-3]|uniref:extensin-like domain-containing protein n=1 Tax=Xanthobacter lutulentifluminis TaxID=3119935 RepID=UPI00372783A9